MLVSGQDSDTPRIIVSPDSQLVFLLLSLARVPHIFEIVNFRQRAVAVIVVRSFTVYWRSLFADRFYAACGWKRGAVVKPSYETPYIHFAISVGTFLMSTRSIVRVRRSPLLLLDLQIPLEESFEVALGLESSAQILMTKM